MKNRYKLSKGLAKFLLCLNLIVLCLTIYSCVSYYNQGYGIWTLELGCCIVLLVQAIPAIPYYIWQIKTAE